MKNKQYMSRAEVLKREMLEVAKQKKSHEKLKAIYKKDSQRDESDQQKENLELMLIANGHDSNESKQFVKKFFKNKKSI